MILVKNTNTEPYKNMAFEEYLLRTCDEPAVMLWRNEPAVIIGKNQNAREQVNFDFTLAHGVKTVRRLTGGGAVFHDLGNVNYTFITPATADDRINFAYFCRPVIEALSGLGIKAALSGRNDLTVSDGRKFSGTAACAFEYGGKTKLMHHGTLLFSADMSYLTDALKVDPDKIQSKGIKSVKSRVTNLCEHISTEFADMTAEGFKEYLENYFIGNGAKLVIPDDAALSEIEKLAEEKYASEAWLFGAKTESAAQVKAKRFDFGKVACETEYLYEVGKSAKIKRVKFSGDFFGTKPIEELEKMLCLTEAKICDIINVLEKAPLSAYICGAAPEEICSLILL